MATDGANAEMTVERDVMIPMRDGVRLQADIYRPSKPARYPVLVTRSPYGRSDPVKMLIQLSERKRNPRRIDRSSGQTRAQRVNVKRAHDRAVFGR